MPDTPAIAQAQFGCFAAWQAEHAGWSRHALGRAVRSGRLIRVRQGVYRMPVSGDTWTQRRTAHGADSLAAVLSTPGTRVSGSAAAVLHGLSLLAVPRRACVSGERWLTGSVPGAHLHRCAPSRLVRFGAADCDGVARTVLDIAREHGVTAGVVTLDHALHERLVDLAHVHAELAAMKRWPGSRRAQRAVELCDGRSESVLESRSRLLIDAHGLPTPRLQVSLGNAWGGFVARVDCYWDEFGVVGEVDGAVKYDDRQPDSLLREKRRQEMLEDLGLQVVRWDKAGIDDFAPTAARLRRAFARAALRPGEDRRWTVLSADVDLPGRG